MSWNRPTSNTVDATSSSRPDGRDRKPGLRRGLLAGVIVVALGSAALWFFTSQPQTSNSKPRTSTSLIKEVTPALPPKSAKQLEKEAHPGMVKVRGKWYPEYNEKGGKIWVTKNWIRYQTPHVITNTSNLTRMSPASKLFDNQADRDIANLLTIPLGTTVIGNWEFTDSFTRQFLKSIETPIIVTKDDDEWAAELKRAVNQTKIELKARYDAGEDIAKIMTETREEMQKLGIYKMELERTIKDSIREAKGDKEQIKDVYDAANKMLAERGIEPLKMPEFLTRNLKMNTIEKNGNKENQ